MLGVERLAADDIREAIPLLQAALKLEPNSVAAHAWLACAFHLPRRLDEAALHYKTILELEPVRAPNEAQRAAILRHAPRLFQVASDPFPLRDAVAIHHPEKPLIAYHLFWDDDIDFPEDNDPCDHEVVWVEYDAATRELAQFFSYFHRRILTSPEAVADAARNEGRPRVNVQWGKHGSLPHGWQNLKIQADTRDIEREYLQEPPVRLADYNRATYKKLVEEGRRLADHPRTRDWPVKFEGSWDDFVRFEKPVDLVDHLKQGKLAVSRWNSAVLQQQFLSYNFRPKTEWPDDPALPASLQAQRERRIGASQQFLMSPEERAALRYRAARVSKRFADFGRETAPSRSRLRVQHDFLLPSRSVFHPSTPRYPNLWIYGPVEQFESYPVFLTFLESRFRSHGYRDLEVTLNEGADLAFSIEHLQPWNDVEGLRHAHAIHIRFFWKRLQEQRQHRVNLPASSRVPGDYWRVAASVHYEVEHAHPLHADVEVCPYCGRTGAYADKTGHLVERVHDPLGLELCLWGSIRNESVEVPSGLPFPSLREFLKINEDQMSAFSPESPEMNTEVLAVAFIDRRNDNTDQPARPHDSRLPE